MEALGAGTMRRWSWRRTCRTCHICKAPTGPCWRRRRSRRWKARCWCWATAPSIAGCTRGGALRAWAAQQATDCMVLTSQKDLVKLRLAQLNGRSLWALRIGLTVETGQEVLDRNLNEVLRLGSSQAQL